MFPTRTTAPMTYFDEQARFEAMRNQSKNGQILQKHESLRKTCENLILRFEKEARYETSRLTLNQSQYSDRLHKLRALEKMVSSRVASLKALNSNTGGSKFTGQKKSVLLFRIENKEGMNVYINVTNSRPIQMDFKA